MHPYFEVSFVAEPQVQGVELNFYSMPIFGRVAIILKLTTGRLNKSNLVHYTEIAQPPA